MRDGRTGERIEWFWKGRGGGLEAPVIHILSISTPSQHPHPTPRTLADALSIPLTCKIRVLSLPVAGVAQQQPSAVGTEAAAEEAAVVAVAGSSSATDATATNGPVPAPPSPPPPAPVDDDDRGGDGGGGDVAGTVDFARQLVSCGAAMVTVHGRTRQAKHNGR